MADLKKRPVKTAAVGSPPAAAREARRAGQANAMAVPPAGKRRRRGRREVQLDLDL